MVQDICYTKVRTKGEWLAAGIATTHAYKDKYTYKLIPTRSPIESDRALLITINLLYLLGVREMPKQQKSRTKSLTKIIKYAIG